MVFWLNAIPNMQKVRQKIGEYGGKVLYQYRTGVTHLVCINLSQSKYDMYKNSTKVKIIYPEYIDACISANKILPEDKYLYDHNKVTIHQNDIQDLLDFKLTQQEFQSAYQLPEYDKHYQDIQNCIDNLQQNYGNKDYYCTYQPYKQIDQYKSQSSQIYSPQPFNLAQYYQELQELKQEEQMQIIQQSTDNYWKNSRLHMLNEYKLNAQQFLIENPPCGPTPIQTEQPLYLHIDIDCFFVQGSLFSMTLAQRRQYENMPVAISSVQQPKIDSTADISSCNYIARNYGIKNGMWVKQAFKLCPNLKIINYNFEYYKVLSRKFYSIIRQISSDIMPVSCDEAYIRVNGLIQNKEEYIQKLKQEIKDQIGLTCTIGMGSSMIIARIATKLNKPNGFGQLSKVEFLEKTQQKPVSFIPGIGEQTEQLLKELNILTLHDLRGTTTLELQQYFGQQKGQNIQSLANGVDVIPFKPVATIFNNTQLSVSKNYNIQVSNYRQLEQLIGSMLEELQNRNKSRNIDIRKIQVSLQIQSKLNNERYQKYLGMGLCDSITQYVDIEQNKKYQQYANYFTSQFSQIVQFEKIKGISVTGFKQSNINSKLINTKIDQYIYNQNIEKQQQLLIQKIEQNSQIFKNKYYDKNKIQEEYLDNIEIFQQHKQVLFKLLQIQVQYWSKIGNIQKVKQTLQIAKKYFNENELQNIQQYNSLISFHFIQIIVSSETEIKLSSGDIIQLQELQQYDKKQIKNVEILTPVIQDSGKHITGQITTMKEIQSKHKYLLKYKSTLDQQNYDKQLILGEDSKPTLISIGNLDKNKILREKSEGYEIQFVKPIVKADQIINIQLLKQNFVNPQDCIKFLEKGELLFVWEPTIKQFLQLSYEERDYFQLVRVVSPQQNKLNSKVQEQLRKICNTDDQNINNLLYLCGVIILYSRPEVNNQFFFDISEFQKETAKYILQITNQLNIKYYQEGRYNFVLQFDKDEHMIKLLQFLNIYDQKQWKITLETLDEHVIQHLTIQQKYYLLSGLSEQAKLDISQENFGFEICFDDIQDSSFEKLKQLALQLGLITCKYQDDHIIAGNNIANLLLTQRIKNNYLGQVNRCYFLDYSQKMKVIYSDSKQLQEKYQGKNNKIIQIGMFEPFKIINIEQDKQQQHKMLLLQVSQPYQLSDNTLFF